MADGRWPMAPPPLPQLPRGRNGGVASSNFELRASNFPRGFVASWLYGSLDARCLAVAALTFFGACKREAPPNPIAVKEYVQPDTPPAYAAPT